jgi:hypothetical protein
MTKENEYCARNESNIKFWLKKQKNMTHACFLLFGQWRRTVVKVERLLNIKLYELHTSYAIAREIKRIEIGTY